MKQISHRIASLFMAFVVLFSTMSFTIDMHYCGDTLVDTAIFNKVKRCGMELQNPSTPKGCSVSKKNCCSDQQIAVDGQNELKINSDTLSFEQQKIVVSFVCTHINLFEGIQKDIHSFTDYIPPLVVRQLFKLDETYLI